MKWSEIKDRAEYLSAVADISSASKWRNIQEAMTIEDKIAELADLIAAIADKFED